MVGIDAIHKLIEDKNYAKAIEEADKVIKQYPTSGPLLLIRSLAHLRAGNLQQALADSEKAIITCEGTKRADAQLRRAVCLYRLNEFGKAKQVLQYAEGTSEKNLRTYWLSKLKTSNEEEVPEIPAVDDMPTAAATSANTALSAAVKPSETRTDWFQSDEGLTFIVYQRGAPQEAKIVIESQRVGIDYDGFSYSHTFPHEIIPDQSKYTVNKFNIEFALKKSSAERWNSIEVSKDFRSPAPAPAPSSTTTPSVTKPLAPKPKASNEGKSSDYKPSFEKKWDIDEDSDDDDSKNSDPNAFFEQLFKNADPDTQKAMMKSFTESKGTSLSTNWDEVKKGPVEPQPPKDMKIN